MTARIVGVIGAGTMGEGIAQVVATAGDRVLVFDADPGAAAAALRSVAERLERSVARGRRSRDECDAITARMVAVDALDDLASATIVIEAIVEDLAAKREVLAAVEKTLDPAAIVATNTSSLSITSIAGGLERPEQVAGMHFFNPAPVMPLVEIIRGVHTATEVVDELVDIASAWGKTPIRAASTPGFVGNRVARPFYGESIRLLQEGVAEIATIDSLVRNAGGFPMGPFQLMDLVGIDVNLAVSTAVWNATAHDPRFVPSVLQRDMVDAGLLGRKSGRGFYDYREGAIQPAPAVVPAAAAPDAITVRGEAGLLGTLVDRLEDAGVHVDREGSGDGEWTIGGFTLALTDGRLATDRGPDSVILDLARDFGSTTEIGAAVADGSHPEALPTVAGLLGAAGITLRPLDDTPGLVVARLVSLLVNLAVDTVHLGIATAEDVDRAMRLGFNYPEGPLAWGDDLGAQWVATVVRNIGATYGEDRYRISPLLARRAASMASLSS